MSETTAEEPKDPEYPSLRKEINALKPDSPGDRGAMMLLAEMAGREARKMRDAPEARQPHTVTDGYHLAIETNDGPIGMWTCWLRDQIYLGWPRTGTWAERGRDGVSGDRIDNSFNEIDAVRRHFHGVRRGGRMRADYGRMVGDWALSDPAIGEWSLEQGRTMYRHEFKYIGAPPKTVGEGTRIYPQGGGALQVFGYGYDLSEEGGSRLFTELFWRPEDVSLGSYREVLDRLYAKQEPMFLEMACDLGARHEATAVTVEMGFVVIPENLRAMGFNMPSWMLGNEGVREGWGREAVYANRTLPDGRLEEVVLVSANSLVPWVCYRKQPLLAGEKLTPTFVRNLLTF